MVDNLDEVPPEIRTLLEELDISLEPLTPERGVERFLQNEKNEIAEKTVQEHRGKLNFFLEYAEMHEIDDLNDLAGRDIDGYRMWRREESSDKVDTLSNKTMQDEMYLFRKFLKYLESIEAVKPDLSQKVDIPELSNGDGVRDLELPPERARNILEHLRRYEYASREHVVWLLHCHTGRRPGGLYSLDLQDVNLQTSDPYFEFQHREGETPLKNGVYSEEQISVPERVAEPIVDYVENRRKDVVDEYGRDPLLTTSHGRLSTNAMRMYFYKWTRPCKISGECPHDRDIDGCNAAQLNDKASKCPSSTPPYAARHGYLTQMRRAGLPVALVSQRCDVSEEVLKKHYDERSTEEKRELRREMLEKVRDQEESYIS